MESPTHGTRITELAGERLGPYQVVELIGRGGMAVVYKALQPLLRRHIAIKVLPPQFAYEGGFRARFQQEAETVARLEHPNILPIYDYGQAGDISYIVMPLVTGGTLRDWLGEPRPFESALHVFSRILSALEYAHTRQPAIVHRDIKPSNILMSQADWPLLADFGIAKIIEPSVRATGVGTIVGTPQYMAPEQCEGTAVDHRADLYAMGTVLYEMLTGQVPFQGQTPLDVMLQQAKGVVPSPRAVNPALAPVWDEVIRRSMAKEPQHRYPSAKAMEEAIQAAWLEQQGTSGQDQTVGTADPGPLYESARRALAEGDWPRVISLCGQILKIAPDHLEAVQLLTEAHEGMHRQRTGPPSQPAAQVAQAPAASPATPPAPPPAQPAPAAKSPQPSQASQPARQPQPSGATEAAPPPPPDRVAESARQPQPSGATEAPRPQRPSRAARLVRQLVPRGAARLVRQLVPGKAAERPSASTPTAVLTVRQGPEPGRVFALDEGVVTLGRAPENDIALEDSALSRRHCQIRSAAGAYVLEDLGSSNGTYVNGAVVQVAQLQPGDLIHIGNLELEFTLAR